MSFAIEQGLKEAKVKKGVLMCDRCHREILGEARQLARYLLCAACARVMRALLGYGPRRTPLDS